MYRKPREEGLLLTISSPCDSHGYLYLHLKLLFLISCYDNRLGSQETDSEILVQEVYWGVFSGKPVRGERTEQREKVTLSELATEASANCLRNCGAKNDT